MSPIQGGGGIPIWLLYSSHVVPIQVTCGSRTAPRVKGMSHQSEILHSMILLTVIVRLRNLQLGLDQQRELLEQICTKLRVDGAKDNTSTGQTMDSISYYDNVTMYSALDMPIEKTDRRPSLIP